MYTFADKILKTQAIGQVVVNVQVRMPIALNGAVVAGPTEVVAQAKRQTRTPQDVAIVDGTAYAMLYAVGHRLGRKCSPLNRTPVKVAEGVAGGEADTTILTQTSKAFSRRPTQLQWNDIDIL